MDAATLDTTTFTVTGPGGEDVTGTVAYDAPTDSATFTPSSSLAPNVTFAATTGTVSYDPVNFIATFTPQSDLAADTQFVSTITTRVTDPAGNALPAGNAERDDVRW